MATKAEELAAHERGEGCLGKAANGEPLFILRGQDLTAPWLVRQWARHFIMLNSEVENVGMVKGVPQLRLRTPEHIQRKHDEAMKLASQMEAWHIRKIPT